MGKGTHGKQGLVEWFEFAEGPPWVEETIYGVSEGVRHSSAVRLVGRWYGKGLSAYEVRFGLYA